MELILTIENAPHPEMSGRTWRCGSDGGTLGRNPDCDLVLPDPKRYTSSVHAQIEFDQDGFKLTDRSTNGTYHNSPKTLIGKNRSVSLDQGDKVFIGDFVLRVEFEDHAGAGAGAGTPAQATSSTPPQFAHGDTGPGPVAGFDSDPDSESDSEPESEHRAGAGDDSRPWDDSEFSLPWNREGAEPDADDGGKRADDDDEDQAFSQSPEREHFAAPSVSSGSGDAIPDDWDDFLTGFHDPEKLRKSPETSEPPHDDDAWPETEDASSSTPGADSEPTLDSEAGAMGRESASRDFEDNGADGDGKPFAAAEPDDHEKFEPPSEATPAPPPSRAGAKPSGTAESAQFEAQKDAAPADHSSQASRPDASDESGHASAPNRPERSATRAEKAPDAQPPRRPSPAAAQASEDSIHEILQVVTQGLMGLLQGRAEIKNEFRVAQTRFVQTENNPLKFSPNADEALKRILAEEESPGFLTGKRAFEDALDDVQAHQLAILSAVQRAIESAVAQFDPAQIEKKLERISPMSARTPGLRAGKCWNLFVMHYEEVASKMRDDSRQLFLAEFAEAYEEACRSIARGRSENES